MIDPRIRLVRISSIGTPAFDCGASAQNDFLANLALSSQYAGVSATHLAFRGDVLVGYVTLAMSTVVLERHELPAGATVRSLPALLVAQLAVSKDARGQRIGDWLLKFAAGVAQTLRHQVGCRFLVVDCDEDLVPFYERYGFSESKGESRKRKAAAKDRSGVAGGAKMLVRLCKDILGDEWFEADVAPPHLRLSELHRAAADNDLPMLEALLATGVSTECEIGRGDDGRGSGAKPLHLAAARGACKTIEALLAAGAEINAIDGDCETALHWAVRHGESESVALLLKHGADPSIEGGNALFTPLDYAVHNGRADIAAVLRNAGAVHSDAWSEGEV